MSNRLLALFLLLFLITSFGNPAQLRADPTLVPQIIDLEAINPAVKPCDNFYQYACGSWLQALQLPADKSTYYHQSTALDDQTSQFMRKLLETAPVGSPLQKFFSNCMDSTDAQANSLMSENFKFIRGIKTPADLALSVAHLHRIGTNLFFSLSPAQNLKDATKVVGSLAQGGLSFPERDYYLKTDEKSVALRQAFLTHVARSFQLAGLGDENQTSVIANKILLFETSLAQAALSLEDQGNPSLTYHPISQKNLKKLVSQFDWTTYFQELGLSPTTTALNLTEPKFYSRLQLLLNKTPLEDLKNEMTWQFILRAAPRLQGELRQENFNFWEKNLRGTKEMKPRWKECTSLVEKDLSETLGQAFVEKIQDAQSVKDSTKNLIGWIKSEFSENLNDLNWLDSETVQAARKKLGLINSKIAFPDKFRDQSAVDIKDHSILQNDFSANEFEFNREIAKIGKPLDRTEWYMNAWEINAYYDPSMNEIVFPYGTLQSPVFDLKASNGANMGALGATVGHELTHGFDNDGSKFDGFGNAKDWWAPAIRKKFEQHSQCLIDQANQYQVLPGLSVNGTRTLTENIADQGGTKIAYLAFKKMSAGRPPAPAVGGFNEEQQFFLSYAQSWCAKRTDEGLRYMVTSDVHPPEEFRVNGVLFNLPEFSRAFSCVDGKDTMAPPQRCSVW